MARVHRSIVTPVTSEPDAIGGGVVSYVLDKPTRNNSPALELGTTRSLARFSRGVLRWG